MKNLRKELQRLWAPWRCAYVTGTRGKGCVFCEKARSKALADDLILARGKHVYVLMNTYPYNAGHLLVAPYAHVAYPGELPRAAQRELWDMALAWQTRLSERMRAGGINIGMNLGVVAGAGIADHLHLHIVPRWQGDTNFITTVAGTRVVSQGLRELYDRLVK